MIRNFKNLEEYNVFTNNGQNLVSGDLYWIDNIGCYFLTNNIDGELKKYDALDEIPPEYIIPTGNVEITSNGENINVHDYATASVNVPIPEGYIIPTGNKTITENGQEIDVYDYATATVNVQPDLTTKTITENGTYTPQNADGFSSVTVNVPIPPEYIIPTGNKEITSNGTNINVHDYATASVNVQPDLTTQTITENGTYSPQNADGFSSVTVSVSPDLTTQTITENGTYTPQNHDGFSSVTVNVATGGGSQDLIDLIEGDITTLNIPAGTTKIKQYAFYYCSGLTSVTIPNSVTSIDQRAFYYCNHLPSINISDSVTSIGDNAFYNCTALTSITIPNASIGANAFYQCSGLTSVTIGNGVTSIGSGAFHYCYNMTSIAIGNSVTSIGNEAFSSCNSLTSVMIPDSVTSIDGYAFSSCSNLTSVTVEATTPPTLASGAFSYTSPSLVIYVPAESVETYKGATNWSSYASRIQAISE